MISTVNHTPAAIELRPQTRMSIWLPIAFFSVLWIDLVRQLSFHWESSEQYAYGWFVPFLSLALFWKRWMTRSAPQVHPSPKWLAGAVAILGGSLLPIRLADQLVSVCWLSGCG